MSEGKTTVVWCDICGREVKSMRHHSKTTLHLSNLREHEKKITRPQQPEFQFITVQPYKELNSDDEIIYSKHPPMRPSMDFKVNLPPNNVDTSWILNSPEVQQRLKSKDGHDHRYRIHSHSLFQEKNRFSDQNFNQPKDKDDHAKK
ncbi:hypothetical protein ABK040_016733 [Willaertia magna]